MDTTLITFMLQTSPSIQSVHLIGSWDNFSKHYPMERDVKRSRGQWRGCYTFEDIICDGDGRSYSKRTGGLKMGSTYYYYYELDHGTEHYDASIPFTTSCPYLPGQPVNLLSVPIEVQSLRQRSASMTSIASSDIKTMNPADKYTSPRHPPPLPTLPRLNTSPSPFAHKRTARSLSPKLDKQWSPRAFFGRRSPLASLPAHDGRGRSSSLGKMPDSGLNSSTGTITSQAEDVKKIMSPPQSRSPSPPSLKRSHVRDPSPLRHIIAQENSSSQNATFTIADIVEDIEDDDNFACDLHRISFHERGLHTQLSPPPPLRPSPVRTLTDTSKPLPELPFLAEENHSLCSLPATSIEEDSQSHLVPAPLRLLPDLALQDDGMPRSHFSISTFAPSIVSPSDSSFCLSEIADDEDLTADLESGDDSTYSPILEDGKGFSGYSLPEQNYASEHTLRKQTPLSPLSTTSNRTTFGASGFAPTTTVDAESMSALEQLMSEMGYLGNMIVGK